MAKRVGGKSGRYCVVKGCANSSGKLQKWKNDECQIHSPKCRGECPCARPYSLHRFPGRKDHRSTRQRWIANVNRKKFVPKSHSVICSVHFLDGRPTATHPYPTLNMGYIPARPLASGRAPPKKRMSSKQKQGRTASVKTSSSHPQVSIMEQGSIEETREITSKLSFHDVGVQWYPPATADHDYCTVSKDKKSSVATQTDTRPTFQANDMDDTTSKFYTGLSKDMFWAFLTSLISCLTKPFTFHLPVPEQLLLVLMRLRLGLMFTDLAHRFHVSRTTACEIFATWIPVIADYMRTNVILWLPRDTLRRIRPSCFIQNFPNASCIIDCTEIFVQRPQNLKQRAQTYSNYKHHNTYKALYCIAPNGLVMFVSKLFGGRASDPFISQCSGFLNQLLPGDEVLADRGFTIDAILPPGVKLAIPAFTRGLNELPEDAVTETRRLANVRIHVERAIRRLKCYKILSSIISGRVKNVDNILIACAGLCNLQPLLIKQGEESDDQGTHQEMEHEENPNVDYTYMFDIHEDIE